MTQLQYGQIPIYNPNQDVFLKQPEPHSTKLSCGKAYLTGYLKAPSEFNLLSICHSGDYPEKIVIEEIVYKDPFGNICKLSKRIEFIIHAQMDDYTWGFSTKVNNLRWGCNIKYNARTGNIQISTDYESPIIGIYVRLG